MNAHDKDIAKSILADAKWIWCGAGFVGCKNIALRCSLHLWRYLTLCLFCKGELHFIVALTPFSGVYTMCSSSEVYFDMQWSNKFGSPLVCCAGRAGSIQRSIRQFWGAAGIQCPSVHLLLGRHGGRIQRQSPACQRAWPGFSRVSGMNSGEVESCHNIASQVWTSFI